MLWDPGSVKKDEEGHENVPVTPILVPLQKKAATVEKGVPVLVPDVQDLKDQFQQQQNMLTQIKETLKQNECQLSSKGKQVEVYANKLSQIRARSKNTQGKKSSPVVNPSSSSIMLTKKSSKENLMNIENPDNDKSGNNSKNRKGKVSELKKCLEENKIKFEQRTGKEQTETKKIESLVEQLKTQLEERDKTIQDLQKNIEQPTPKPDSIPKKTKPKSDNESVASKTTQTNRTQPSDESIEIIALQNKIHELEANVLDLEENLKEKESVIEARTQAVTLLSQDLSLKGKNTLESLEETRQEMRTMQNNFIIIEDQLKNDLSDRDNRLALLEEKCKKLESNNFELSLKNAEQQEKLVNLQSKYLEVDAERKSLKESPGQGQSDDKSDELIKKISVLTKELDDRNKAMIKMKIEHKNKIKNINKTLETLKETSDEKAEIVRLSNLVGELENIKTGLENRVAELEDEKVTEKKLKDQINELEILVQKQNEDLSLHLKTISNLEKENLDLIQSTQDQNILIENLQGKIQTGDREESEKDSRLKELSQRLENMEKEYNRKLEELKGEHKREMETLELYYNARGETLDRKELEEYRISTEMNNIHVEEQIELLIREKQQLLEKLKSLSGVSSTDSLTFEKMEHSDLRDDKETTPQLGTEVDSAPDNGEESRMHHLERITNDQQHLINELQKTIREEKDKAATYEQKITELENSVKNLEEINVTVKQKIEMAEAAEPSKNSKSNVNAKNRIKKIEMELSESKKTIEQQNEKLKELNQKLEEKEELIKNYTERIESFEKDDWDRQNHWKNTEDEFESIQELQKKCLSLENSLIELNEDCERLRKENIEVVHLLSEEKVKRRKLLEKLEAKPESRDAETQKAESLGLEERINALTGVIGELEEKIEKMETHLSNPDAAETEQWEVVDLQQKLEWANVVLTGKETEIFRLQNLLEDKSKVIENLEGDLKEYRAKLAERDQKLSEIIEELKVKEIQLEEISANFDKLQESVEVANQKTATNESQLNELLATVKEMEGDVVKKETELQEIKGILAEKNLDMTNLRNRLEEVNSDLTYSYQEHLENMGKCLRDKESDYDVLLAEKTRLEDFNRCLVTEKEDIYNQKVEMFREKEKLRNDLLEKEKLIAELTERVKAAEKPNDEGKDKSQAMEEMKIKMKKLAANLKKRAQSEADLAKQVKELEESLAEKEKTGESLKSELKQAAEKWEVEKAEKEKIQVELSEALSEKVAAEAENKVLNEKISSLETQLRGLQSQVQNLEQACGRFQMIEQQDKQKIAELEAKSADLSALYEKATSTAVKNDEIENEKTILLQKLAEITGKYEETKFRHDQLLLEKSELERRLEEAEKICEGTRAEKSSLDAKVEENFAVIESLEAELKKTRDHMKAVEEKFFHSEERRMSLENKNEEMCKKIMEDSENLVTIDDLSVRVDELLKSEKRLQDCVRNLDSGNSELKQALDEAQNEKYSLEKELKAATDKITEMSGELKELKDSESEKSALIREMTKEVERLRADNKQISSEFAKLNRDYEQFEVDFKENLENSQALEKSLRHKIEELANENASLSEKCNLMTEFGGQGETKTEEVEESRKPKKRKSVTFRTDEVEYIKDLKNQLHKYDANLKKANEEIESLRGELFREKLRSEVSDVVAEAEEKVESLRSTPEKSGAEVALESEVVKTQASFLAADKSSPEERKFDANVFFGNASGGSFEENLLLGATEERGKCEEQQQNSEFDSLAWDDGWGAEGHLEEEYLSGRVAEPIQKVDDDYEAKIKSLSEEIATLQTEKEKLSKELQDQVTKYAKAIKKLKEVKNAHDKLLSEMNKVKVSSGFGDLDAAIVDELKSQIQRMEVKEKELLKNLENFKLEKESLLKKIDVLNAGNEKFLEMKERQDNEVEIWQRKNNELLKEISDLRQELRHPQIPDDDLIAKENRELRNKVEALEWKNCELSELLEEKQELLEGRRENPPSDVDKVMEEKSLLQKEIEELNNVRERLERKLFDEEKKSSLTIGELNEQLTALATENETLQDILGEMKKSADASKKEKPKESKIFDYFKSSGGDDFFAAAPPLKSESQPKEKDPQAEDLRKRVLELEELLRVREEEVNALGKRIIQLEEFLKPKDDELNLLREKFAEVENVLRMKEEECCRLAGKEKEVEELRKRLGDLEKEKEILDPKVDVFQPEGLNDEEFRQLRQASENQMEAVRQQMPVKTPDQFETIDLSRGTEAFPDSEGENWRQRVFDLEALVSFREKELEQIQREKEEMSKEYDLLRQREEELTRSQSISWNQEAGNEAEMLRQKIRDLEEFARFKENETFQIQALHAKEIQNLNQRIFELENLAKARPEGPDPNERIFQLETTVRFKEEELFRVQSEKGLEIEGLRQRIAQLENLLPVKDEEINRLATRLNELDKSYNDSKLEIERLLNEEKLNTEEKFVEPFQNNMNIPVSFELEALSRTLDEEKQKVENMQYELAEKENILRAKEQEVQNLAGKLAAAENKLKEFKEEENRSRLATEESFQVKSQLEKMVTDLQEKLESSNLQLNVTRRELEEFQSVKDEAMAGLKGQLFQMEAELVEARERERSLAEELRSELEEKTKYYEAAIKERREEEEKRNEAVRLLEKSKRELEKEVEVLKGELESKENDIETLGRALEEERKQVAGLKETLQEREGEVADLKETLTHLQEEIGHFRNFEKQVKELRVSQIQGSGGEVPVTAEGHPDLSDWSEHELAELSTRLQSDLDTALYMLHQRDVRCDELTFELMQLLEERDTLQLRLSTALRINEELRALNKTETTTSSFSLQENKDLVDQSNDRQAGKTRVPSEDLRQLANKISELHSVSYLRDKTVKDDSMQRHTEQMNLLSRVSDSDITLSRDVQSSPAVLLNWMRGKSTPKVMHI